MKLIGLCGYPESGKSTVQEILYRLFGAEPQDDGLPLRGACMSLYGLSWEDVSTQEGKRRITTICGVEHENRALLGHLGNLLEGFYGDQVIPEMALRAALAEQALNFYQPPALSFGSVRKNQGLTYKKHGGIVVEIVRDGTAPRYDFDHYDRSLVDVTIINNFATVGELETEVVRTFRSLGFVELPVRTAA